MAGVPQKHPRRRTLRTVLLLPPPSTACEAGRADFTLLERQPVLHRTAVPNTHTYPRREPGALREGSLGHRRAFKVRPAERGSREPLLVRTRLVGPTAAPAPAPPRPRTLRRRPGVRAGAPLGIDGTGPNGTWSPYSGGSYLPF